MNAAGSADASARSALWADAHWALQALQVDGPALGGAWIKARHGPVRDVWLQTWQQSAPRAQRLPIHADDPALLGGIDLSATLQSGRLQWQTGLLAQADGAWLLMPMAERAPRALLARLTQTMDNRQISDPRGHTLACHSTLFAVDESDPDEAVLHTSVAQRLAFWIQDRKSTRLNSSH